MADTNIGLQTPGPPQQLAAFSEYMCNEINNHVKPALSAVEPALLADRLPAL